MHRGYIDLKVYLSLLVILTVFVLHSVSLNFTQDDAFISYRYVRNFIQGHGLVFNPGERVEGYTNFLWIILLAMFTRLGADMITASKILGVASGCIALILLYRISALLVQTRYVMRGSTTSKIRRAPTGPALGPAPRIHDSKEAQPHWLFAIFPSLLLASNSAFAYWSISGLETSFFVMTVLLSVYFYLSDNSLMIVSAALASLVRPEGVLVFAIIILHKLLARKASLGSSLRDCLTYVVGFGLLTAPFLVFRILYYKDALPNPFYAKTGFSLEYVKSGIAYFWLFLKQYGLWGAIYLMPLAFYRNLKPRGSFILVFFYAYTFYVILIGGDVLRAHRFFLPVLPFAYLIFTFAAIRLSAMLRRQAAGAVFPALCVAAFAAATFFVPRASILFTREAEIALYAKMARHAQAMKRSFGNDFTLATSTIGAVSYITDVKVIDMLGLTDRYIAKHPENIPGIVSIWKEKTFNTKYLLSRDPDVILFSTGMRPSAPAEKALFLSSKFRQNYYPYYLGTITGMLYKRKGPYFKENVIFPDPTFVNLYSEALYLGPVQHNLPACIDKLEEIIEIGPQDFARPYEYMGTCYYLLGRMEDAKRFARKAAYMDDYCIEAHWVLHKIYASQGDAVGAKQEADKVRAYNPERFEKP
jgi:tetratricopeptide (TPR) repeat protein